MVILYTHIVKFFYRGCDLWLHKQFEDIVYTNSSKSAKIIFITPQNRRDQ